MTKHGGTNFIRFSAIALMIAGILFVLYPALRPFSDEASLSGAAAFASTQWVVSHTMAILAFILLTAGLLGLYVSFRNNVAEKLALNSLILTLFGTGLTLPFYGAEVWGLHAFGQEAINRSSADLMSLANAVRFGPGFYTILAGLVLLAVSAAMMAVAIWKSRTMPPLSGIPFAFGLLLYLPQYMAIQPIRVAHGMIIAVGCFWMAAGMWRQSRHIG